MCGIVGLLNLHASIDPEELDGFTDALHHRGPDGRGTFIDGKVGLGHRRLAILDLSDAGRCPMSYGGADGQRYWITFNGEIYNFLELRAELERYGHRFRSDSDTEVILAAYAQWGEDCLPRFNGMWAFAIWDREERSLFLARDRFGIKPLYYFAKGRFAFASELKAFLELRGVVPELDTDAVPMVLENSYAFEGMTDLTLMRGVHRLLAGHALRITERGDARTWRWWRTSENLPAVPSRYEEQVEGFRDLFLDAVSLRMRSDVPIGVSLSGGIDSSAVSSAMAQIRRQEWPLQRGTANPLQAFIASFPGTDIDETHYADEVAQHIGAASHHWIFDADEAVGHVVDWVWSLEDVYGGIGVPAWGNYRAMRRQGLTVSLEGHGADELLAGYPWYFDVPMNALNEHLYQCFHASQQPSILRNVDRASMAHGVEVRMPLMDWRLVTYAFALPPESKLGGGHTKRVLRDAMAGIMPERIRMRRSKLGFNSPMVEWFNGGLSEMIFELTQDPLWQDSPFWSGRELGSYFQAKTRSQAWTSQDWGECLRLWTYLNLVLWQKLFLEKSLLKASR